jgi:hypothetical protein
MRVGGAGERRRALTIQEIGIQGAAGAIGGEHDVEYVRHPSDQDVDRRLVHRPGGDVGSRMRVGGAGERRRIQAVEQRGVAGLLSDVDEPAVRHALRVEDPLREAFVVLAPVV